MKCELCHKAEAQTVLVNEEGDDTQELYVCNACAKAEKLRKQKNSQRTRKVTDLPPGISMSITQIGGQDENGENPPQIIDAIMNAFNGMVSDLEKVADSARAMKEKAGKQKKYREFPLTKIDQSFRIGNLVHLEALHMIGEIEAVKRSMHAMDMELVGVSSDGVNDAGHAYTIRYACTIEQARRVVDDMIREEQNARIRLFEEMSRVFSDGICRALALMKNCRLLSPGEYFDLLSPLRLAAMESVLDGISQDEIEKRMLKVDLSGFEDRFSAAERDQVDAKRADEVNRRFEDVVLNERAEENLP